MDSASSVGLLPADQWRLFLTISRLFLTPGWMLCYASKSAARLARAESINNPTSRSPARPPPKKIKQHTINQSIKPSQAGLVLVRSSSRFEAIRATATPQKEARPPGRSSPRTIETWPSFSDAIRLPRLLRHRCGEEARLGWFSDANSATAFASCNMQAQ